MPGHPMTPKVLQKLQAKSEALRLRDATDQPSATPAQRAAQTVQQTIRSAQRGLTA